MALAEVQAFFRILSSVTEIVVRTSNAYYRASDDLQAFPHKVANLNLRQKDWEGLLQTHSLPIEDPVVGRLKQAKEMLEEELRSFEEFQKANCCLRFYKKVAFPSGIIANLDDVSKAFDGILQGMKEKKEAEDLLTEAANRRLAPFSFLMDDKYVPIMETVKDIKAALASESPSGTMVLLHGESGRGKTTMAKYLALEFHEELKKGNGEFPGGIFFLACEKSTNALLLMAKLWEDLGLGSQGPYPVNPESRPKQESYHEQMESQKFDNLRRRVMAELQMRQMRDSRTMLIIIDNVSKQELVNDMRIQLSTVKYLVTSQKPYQGSVTTRIMLAKPSMEEARKILRKHSGTWTEDTPLAPQVQIEVDELIKQADFNTLVLANLGAIIKSQALDSNSKLEPRKLRELKEGLYFLLNHMDEDTYLDATIFSGTYKQTIAASMTLIVDNILSEEARTMIYLMVMCEDLTVNEAIVKVWFHRIYGKSIGGSIKLKTQTVIVFESEDASWRQEPLMRWSIHELRREFIREKKKEALQEIMEKLMEEQSEEDDDDDDLIAALCLLYGDATWRSKVQSASKLQVHENFRKHGYDQFIKSFSSLLHPRAKDESQKLSHKSAKEVMLCALKYGKLEDEVISQLLRSPEVDLATCYALQSSWIILKSSLLPKVVSILATKIASHLHVDINSNTREKLSMYLQAFRTFRHDQTSQIVPDLPQTLCSLLQQPQDVKISTNLLRVLESLSWGSFVRVSSRYNRRIASIPDLLKTLVRFMDKDIYPDLFELSIRIMYQLVWHPRGEQIRVNLGAIPNALQNLIDLSPFTITAARTLTELAGTPSIAEKIASTPANLRSLLQLLDHHNFKLVSSVLQVFEQLLSTSSSRNSVCACPEALERLVEIINEDIFMKDHDRSSWERPLASGVAVAVRLITNCGKEFESFLSAGLAKYMTLLADGVIPTIQIRAVQALEYLASESAICTTLRQLYPEVGAQLLKLMDEDADVVSFNCLTDAFHTIIVKQPEHGDWNCVNEAVIRYVTLLEVGKLQEGAARALNKLSLKLETCKLLDSSTVQKLVGLVREGTSSSTIEYVTYTLKSIWIKREVMSYTDVLISEALRRYVALLEDGVEQNLQSESARALGMFGYLTPHRELIIKYPGALQKLSEIIRVNGNPSILSNVASALKSITVRGTNLQGVVGSFFSTALERYVSLLVDGVEEELQEGAVRALGKLAFNETVRKLFCCIPNAIQCLLGRLKRSFVDKSQTLKDLAIAIDKLLVSGKELEEPRRSTILSQIAERYIDLLGDEDLYTVQVDALRALTALCKTGTPSIAEKIASPPANLRPLLQLLGGNHSFELVSSVLDVFEQLLSTSSSRNSVCACPEALERLVEIINEDTFMEDHDRSLRSWERPLSRGVAVAVRLITNCGKEFESFLSAGLAKYMTLLADGVIPTIQIRAVQGLEYLASESAICTTLRQLYPEVGAQLLKLMDEDADVVSFNCLTDAFHTIIVKQPEHGDWNCVNEAIIRYATLLEVGKLQEGAARALSKLSLKLETCKLLDSSTVQKLVGLVREGTSSSTLKHVTYTLKSIWIKREAMSYTDVLISEALRRYVALLEDGVEQNLQSESARALGMFGYLTPHRELIIKYPGALQKLSEIIRVNGNPSILSNVASALESITVRGTDLQGVVGSFFSTALERYVSLLVDGVGETLQEGAVRALGKLAFNETVRKLFCCIPNAIQCLLGRLERSFVDKSRTLEDLAIAIDKLLVPGKELEETKRWTILSQVAERYIDLLGDEDQHAVQVQALEALTALCKTDDGRRCVFTLPGAIDRIVGLLDLNIHAVNHAIVVTFAKFIDVSTVGGTNLADEPMVTFLLDATERLIKLVTQLDGAEWILTERILVALDSLALYPTIRKVIFSHPEVQVLLKKLLVEDSTPPTIFVYAAAIAWTINLRRSDLDEKITAEFLTKVLASYSSLQSNVYDVHSTQLQSHKKEAARILDELTSKPAIFDQAKISPMLVAWRVVGVLEKYQHHRTPLESVAQHLHIVTTSNIAVDYSDRESGGQPTTTWQFKLMSEAMKIYVSLLEKHDYITDIKRMRACKAIALQLEPRSEHNPLLSECPSIEEKLLATFAWCEEASILEDIDRQSPSRGPSSKCTYYAIQSLTLINPSSTDQIVLSSSAAYSGRGEAKISLRMYESALVDYDRALELRPNSAMLFCRRAYIRAQLSDISGASSDLHRAVNLDPDDYFCRCELGILQRIMGNLDDALAHLDLAVDLSLPHELFDSLRQRGYVKFLLGDEKGASVDAERAMLSKTVWGYLPVFTGECFSTSSVKYLHFSA